MFGKITIGSKEVEMVANAATPLFFKQLFNEDFFVVSQNLDSEENAGQAVDVFSKIGFIMSKQSDGSNMKTLNEDDYIEWLSQFEPMDVMNATVDIANLYMKQTKPSAKAKN